MYLTEWVDLPAEVLDAHGDGRLVLFVGAGVSVDPPSNLPLFGELAERVAQICEATNLREQFPNEPDAQLGALARINPRVHDLVADILTDPKSHPNLNHELLTTIASAASKPRVVTTNFDNHLGAAATAQGHSLAMCVGPALPLGHKFSGLVHLHGNATVNPGEMVVTDADFGAAYLTEAWATRFLYSMFRDSVVLFVGYSHSDVVMRYLGVGLRGASGRYAFTYEPDSSLWTRLGVTPIAYPGTLTDHAELTAALRSWATTASEGALERNERVRAIAAHPPSADLADLGYVARSIGRADGAAAFCETADFAGWAAWASSTEAFRPNFTADPNTDASIRLGVWFAEKATASTEASDVALEQLRLHRTIDRRFWAALASESRRLLGSAQDTDFERWVAVLLSFPVDAFDLVIRDWLGMLLDALDVEKHREATVLLLGTLLQSRLELDKSWSPTDEVARPRGRVEWALDPGDASLSWPKLLDHIDELAPFLIGPAANALEYSSALETAYEGSIGTFSGISATRAAVEPHDQDAYHESSDYVIDLVRECIRSLAQTTPPFAAALVNRWLASGYPMLRRISISALPLTEPQADHCIEAVLARGLLFDRALHHEVFILLRTMVPDTGPQTRRLLLDAILTADVESRYPVFKRLDFLNWVADTSPDWDEAGAAFEDLRASQPDWTPDEHPDLLMHISTGFHQSAPPFAPAEYAERFDADPAAALGSLLEYDYGHISMGQPSWEDGIAQLRSAVAEDPERGLAAWDALDHITASAEAAQLREAVIDGWRFADSDVPWHQALERLSMLNDLAGYEYSIASMLLEGVTATGTLPEECNTQAHRVATRLWQDRFEACGGGDATPSGDPENDWPGKVTEFLIWVASRILNGTTEEPDTLDEIAAHLAAIADDQRLLAAGPRSAIGSQLSFCLTAFRDLVVATVLPAMAAPNEVARDYWRGFLPNSRLSVPMIEAGLADAVKTFAPNLDALDEYRRRLYFGLVNRIAYHVAAESAQFVLSVMGRIPRHLVPEQLERITRDLDATDACDEMWDRWVGAVVSELARGRPIDLSEGEWCEVGAWITYLRANFGQGVDEFVRHPARLVWNTSVIPHLEDTDLPENDPNDCCRLLEHLLAQVDEPVWQSHRLRPLAQRLVRAVGADVVRPVAERAVSAGIVDAHQWLAAST